jgi:hypothetical protein
MSCGASCDGAAPQFIQPYGSCDVMDGYAVAKAADCPGITCSSNTYFAICNGSEWTSCDCSQPDSGTLITDPNFSGAPCSGCDANTGPGYDAGSAFDDANMVDAGTDATDDAGKDAGSKDAASKDVAVKDGSKPTDAHSDGPG